MNATKLSKTVVLMTERKICYKYCQNEQMKNKIIFFYNYWNKNTENVCYNVR
jgi:hypothetical protein